MLLGEGMWEYDPLMFVQCKLSVGATDDPLEEEAEDMADRVMRMPQPAFVQRKCAHCGEEEKAQRKPLVSFIQKKGGESGTMTSEAVSRQISASRGAGGMMDAGTKSFMESCFDTDFSGVTIHTGSTAVRMSQGLNAKAFTVGNDIYFNEGAYNPQSDKGKHLLAHELTHTIQQNHSIQRRFIQRQERETCTVMHPENCPVYEDWISTFSSLPRFRSTDTAPGGSAVMGFSVIGNAAADPDAAPASPDAPVAAISPQAADHFIDHPTQQWLTANLPPELRLVAYRLPADCADIAIVLRHVWLFYHNRTETYRVNGVDWIVGVQAGGDRGTADEPHSYPHQGSCIQRQCKRDACSLLIGRYCYPQLRSFIAYAASWRYSGLGASRPRFEPWQDRRTYANDYDDQ